MDVAEIRDKIVPLLQEYGAAHIGLFGSAARGAMRAESDVDILVDIPRRISLLDFIGIKQRLEDILGRKVDLVEYRAVKPALREQILRQQMILL